MKSISLILCLGLLLWVEPASAQKEHLLKVSIHHDVRPTLSKKGIEQILQRASELLQQCNVKFKLNGPIKTFTSAPSHISDASSLEEVHSVAANVKVVQKINFCMGRYDKEGFIGCAWRPEGRPKTVIVTTRSVARDLRHILWTHEFGHTTGLQHRVDDELALMTPCKLKLFNTRINQDECRCFLKGSGGCPILGPDPDPGVVCTERR